MRLIQRIFSYFIAFIMIFSSMTAPYVSNVTNTTVYAEEVSSTEEMVTAEDKAVRQGRDEIYDENYTLPQWNHNLLNLGAARQEGLTGAGVSVAVLDTGFYADHPDIQFAGGASLFDDDSWTNDHTGHGTHVAGIIGALAGSAHPGVAPDVSLYGIKVYHQDEVDENGQPLTDIDNIADGIRMAVDMGVHIILISSGAGIDSEALHAAVTYAQNAGVLIVAAAGNGQSFVDYPAAYPEVVAVSSIDANLNPAGDIIYGAENEIAAPGVNITSLSTPDSPYGYPYVAMSGSSQAAPHVAGLAALLMQKYGANAALVREKLHEGAYDLGNENLYGYGLAGFLSEGVMKKAEPEPEAPDSNEDEDQEDDEATSSSSKKDDTTKEQKKKDQQAKKQKENSERRFKRAYREKDADVASYEDSRERKTRHTYITVVPTFKKGTATFDTEAVDHVKDKGALFIDMGIHSEKSGTLKLSAKQIKKLREHRISLLLLHDDFEWTIPAANLNEGPMLIRYEQLQKKLPQGPKNAYHFSVGQHDKALTTFDANFTIRLYYPEKGTNMQLYRLDHTSEIAQWLEETGEKEETNIALKTKTSGYSLGVFEAQAVADMQKETQNHAKKQAPATRIYSKTFIIGGSLLGVITLSMLLLIGYRKMQRS